MPINVTCPGCFTKFTVADKFAGQKGPCKKCKTVIEIPKLEDQIVNALAANGLPPDTPGSRDPVD